VTYDRLQYQSAAGTAVNDLDAHGVTDYDFTRSLESGA